MGMFDNAINGVRDFMKQGAQNFEDGMRGAGDAVATATAPITNFANSDGGMPVSRAIERGARATGGALAGQGADDGFMPRLRGVMTESGSDINRAVNRGDYGAAAGHALRGAVAGFPAAVSDTFAPLTRPVVATASGALDAAKTFWSGGEAPAAPTAPAATAPSTANPSGMAGPEINRQTLQGDPQPALPGSSVDGADGIRKITGPDGRVTYTNDASGSTDIGKVGTVPAFGDEAMQRGLRANAIYASINGGMGNVGNGEMTTTPGMGVIADSGKADTEKFFANANARNAASGLSARQARAYGLEERGQDQQMAIARMNNETQRDNTLRTVGATLRGQDLSHEAAMYGHDITGANARARLGYDMRKDARDFAQKQTEFAATRGDKAFEQKNQGDEAMQKDLEARFRTTDREGKDTPDHGAIASFRTAVDRTLPALSARLKAVGTPEALKKAADLDARGSAALEKGDLDRLQQLHDVRGRIEQSKGVGPNQGTYVHSDNLLDYEQAPGAAGVDHRTFGGNRIVMRNGSSVSINDLALKDGPANSLLWDGPWKTRSTNLTRGMRTE